MYVVLTLVCAAAFWFSGMSLFDAVSHSFSTLSTGGYSTHDDNIGYFKSFPIELVTIVFSLIGRVKVRTLIPATMPRTKSEPANSASC